MPTYEYECSKCKKRFEVFQGMKDEALKKCLDKKCNGSLRRLIGAGAGFIFKGAGFYATDYKSESYKKGEEKDKPTSQSACSGCAKGKSCPIDK